MKTRMLLLLGISSFVALSCATSYQPKGFKGGYYDYPIGGSGNKYLVGFKGNGYTDSETTKKYAFQRAAELCKEKGLNDFQIIDGSQNTDSFSTPIQTQCTARSYGVYNGSNFNSNCTTSGGHLVKRSTYELIIQCKNM